MTPRQFVTKHPVWTIFLVALALRLPFLDGSIDFFDSPQYLWRSAVPNLVEALSSGHAPYHPGYVFFTWLLHQFGGGGTDVNPTLIALVSVLASSVSLVLVFAIGRRLFSDRVAWLSTVLLAATPYVWISSITILVDPVMIVFYLLAIWFYLEWLTFHSSKNSSAITHYALLIGSGLAFGWAMFAHTQIAFWALGFPALILMTKEPKDWLSTVWRSIPWILGPLLAIAAYVGLLLVSEHNQTAPEALRYLLAGNAGDRFPLDLLPAARNLRLVAGSVLAVVTVLGSIHLLVTRTRQGLGVALWLWPGLIVSALYIYSNLVGRASMLALVPAVFVAASWLLSFATPRAGRRGYYPAIFVVLSTIAVSAPLVGRYATESAMMESLNEVRKGLDRPGLYLSSNEAKTLHDYPTFDVVFEMDKDRITADIDRTLAANQPVYVGTDALTYPYYAVDGTTWRIFSVPGVEQYRRHGSLSAYLFNRYELDLVNQVGRYPLGITEVHAPSDRSVQERYEASLLALTPGQSAVLGRIVDERTNQPTSHLQVGAYGLPAISTERIDRFDWPTQLGTAFEVGRGTRTRDPLLWSYTDASGVVVFPLPADSNVQEFALTPHVLATGATQANPPLFVEPTVDVVTQGSEQFSGTAAAVAAQLATVSSGLAEVSRHDDGTYTAILTPLAYELRTSDTIKAGELSGHVSTILDDDAREAVAGQQGNVTFGPWKNLTPGNYIATWRLRRTTEGEDRVLRLDVGYNFGEGTIFEQVVGAGDLPQGQLTEISVPFTVEPHMKLLEFRTLALAGPGFVVDSITVKSR